MEEEAAAAALGWWLQGGVVREAQSVKCLVETQSPSLATDPRLLSEEQSWASRPPFRLPKERGWGEREGNGLVWG